MWHTRRRGGRSCCLGGECGLTALSPVSITLTILWFSQQCPSVIALTTSLPTTSLWYLCSHSTCLFSVPLISQTLVQLRSFIDIVLSAWRALPLLLLINFHSFLKCSLLHEAFPQGSMELLFALSVYPENACVLQSSESFLRQGQCLGPLHICLLV